jgi:CHAD domain-containing protein
MKGTRAGKNHDETAAYPEGVHAEAIRAFGAHVIAERLDQMLAQTEGVLKRDGIEPVHQMRVWSRRARAALDVFAACFPVNEYSDLEREVKAVTGALGEARDLDVSIEKLQRRAAGLPPSHRAGVESFIAHLRRVRMQRQRSVAKAVRRLNRGNLLERFASLSDGVRDDTI